MLSAGISAEIVKKKENSSPSWIPRSLAYLLPIPHTLYTHQPQEGKLNTENFSSLIGLFFCNGIYAGGGMKFGGNEALLDDESLNVMAVSKQPLIPLFQSLKGLVTGNFTSSPYLYKIQGDHFNFSSTSSFALEADGEFLGYFSSFEISKAGKIEILPAHS